MPPGMALAKGRPLTAKVALSMTPPPPQPACCAYMLAPIQHQIWAHLSMTASYLDHLLVVRFPDPYASGTIINVSSSTHFDLRAALVVLFGSFSNTTPELFHF